MQSIILVYLIPNIKVLAEEIMFMSHDPETGTPHPSETVHGSEVSIDTLLSCESSQMQTKGLINFAR